jgi:hypothetical protein
MKNELIATISINAAHDQPISRCGIVPFGAESWTTPTAKAVIAAKAWTWMTEGAWRSGASVIGQVILLTGFLVNRDLGSRDCDNH